MWQNQTNRHLNNCDIQCLEEPSVCCMIWWWIQTFDFTRIFFYSFIRILIALIGVPANSIILKLFKHFNVYSSISGEWSSQKQLALRWRWMSSLYSYTIYILRDTVTKITAIGEKIISNIKMIKICQCRAFKKRGRCRSLWSCVSFSLWFKMMSRFLAFEICYSINYNLNYW